MFVPVGKHIFDLRSITNIKYNDDVILVYVANNPNGFAITSDEYDQLLHYFFSGANKHTDMVVKYVLVGKDMFVTDMITHVLCNDDEIFVFINGNQTGFPLTKNKYELLIKYLLAGQS
jgi:hypothetical protein